MDSSLMLITCQPLRPQQARGEEGNPPNPQFLSQDPVEKSFLFCLGIDSMMQSFFFMFVCLCVCVQESKFFKFLGFMWNPLS